MTTTAPNPHEVDELRRSLTALEYRPVPVRTRGKEPVGLGWQIKARRGETPTANATSLNTGVLCDGLRVIDIDIDDEETAAKVANLAKSMFGPAPERSRENSGRRMLIYRAAEGEPGKRSVAGSAGKVEVLGHGQQFVGYGMHPSGVEFRWSDPALHDLHQRDLAAIAEEQIDDLFAQIAPLIGAAIEKTGHPQPQEMQASAAKHRETPATSDVAELEELLSYINADCSYEEWFTVLAAIHAATGGSAAGLSIADTWSTRGGKKYPGFAAIEKKWRSFKLGGGLTMATIASMAEERGADLAEIALRHGGRDLIQYDEAEAQEASDRLWQSFERRIPVAVETESPEENADEDLGGATDYFDIPEHLLECEGVVGELADWICAWTPEPVRIHAVGAALVIVGTLVGRKVYSKTYPTSTALYIATLAPSGLGKQHAMNCIRLALREGSGVAQMHTGWQVSLPSLVFALQDRASRVIIADEFADKLIGLRSKNASTSQSAISEGLRSLWGTNLSSFSPDVSISSVSRGVGEIERPVLSIYGASTIKDFARSLVSKDVTNGLFNRFLLLPRYGQVEEQPEPDDAMTMPANLREKLQWLYNCLPLRDGNLASRDGAQALGGSAHPEPVLVPFTSEAAALNEANVRFMKSMLRRSDEHDWFALYGRFAEQVKRIAMIVAVGRSSADVTAAQVDASDMTFAQRVVLYSIEQFVLMVRREMVENESQKNYNLVREIIRRAGKKGLLKSEITQRLGGRLTGRAYSDALTDLVEGGEVTTEKIETTARGGRPGHRYFARNAAPKKGPRQ